jgi:streptomycin 6-kinase
MSCCLYCTTATGQDAVLKIPFDAASGRLEARSLTRWARAGASPQVLAAAPSSGVFLMTRVQPGTTAVPTATVRDSEQFCDLITRMARPDLGPMRGLKPLSHITRMRLDWADERFRDPGYDEQIKQLPEAKELLAKLEATSPRHVIHGDLQAKNILVGPCGTWQAIDPFTCHGDLNAEAALWAVLQDDGSVVEDRIGQLAGCPLLDEHRLRAWSYVYAVAEYRAYLPATAHRIHAFTRDLSCRRLTEAIE